MHLMSLMTTWSSVITECNWYLYKEKEHVRTVVIATKLMGIINIVEFRGQLRIDMHWSSYKDGKYIWYGERLSLLPCWNHYGLWWIICVCMWGNNRIQVFYLLMNIIGYYVCSNLWSSHYTKHHQSSSHNNIIAKLVIFLHNIMLNIIIHWTNQARAFHKDDVAKCKYSLHVELILVPFI